MKLYPDQFIESMFIRHITVADAGIDSKLFTFWRRENLIDFVPERKWARLSFIEVIWIKVLLSLRDFGCSLEVLKRVHFHFFVRAYESKLAKKVFEEIKQRISNLKTAGKATEEDLIQLAEINEVLKDRKLSYIYNRQITFFSQLLMKALKSQSETGILVFADGSIAEFYDDKYFYLNEPDEYISFNIKYEFHPPHIYLPLTYYLNEFMAGETMLKYNTPLSMLTDDELEIVRQLRNENLSEIRIELKDGKICRIESTKKGILTKDDALRIGQMLRLKNYERITLETRDEKTISFKRTKKKLRN